MKNTYYQIIVILSILLFVSCSSFEEDNEIQLDTTSNQEIQEGIVPLDLALNRLESFLSKHESSMLMTKGNNKRQISSISLHYPSVMTKGENDSLALVPDSYIVNFDDNNGFAVLGAVTTLPDIICVTEHGNISDDLIPVVSTPLMDTLSFVTQEELTLEEIDPYCEEDDDYYCMAQGYGELIHDLISNALDNNLDGGIDNNLGPDNPGYASHSLNECERLLETNWGQSDYNEYCFRDNLAFERKSALPGCSTTALAMIMAYNQYPSHYTVNDTTLDWSSIRTVGKITDYPSDAPSYRQIQLLMGSIYNTVNKIAVKGATLITPEQIKQRMAQLGYSNVTKYKASSLTLQMMEEISEMLGDAKPAFLSAVPNMGHLLLGHSWVVDGARYSDSNYLMHFNFGWNGSCNGYYSRHCLNPARAKEYDSTGSSTGESEEMEDEKDYEYKWHFRLITYDIGGYKVRNVSFTY